MNKWRVLLPPVYWIQYLALPVILVIVYFITNRFTDYYPSHRSTIRLDWILMGNIWMIILLPIIPWRSSLKWGQLFKDQLIHEQWNFQLPISHQTLFLKAFLPIFSWMSCLIFIAEIESPPRTDLIIEMNQRTPQHTEENRKQILQYFPKAISMQNYTDKPNDPKPYYRPAMMIQNGQLLLNELRRYQVALILMSWFAFQYWAIQKIRRQNRIGKIILVGVGVLFGFLILKLLLLYFNKSSLLSWLDFDSFNLWLVSNYANHRWEVLTLFIILFFALARYGLHAFKNREMEG